MSMKLERRFVTAQLRMAAGDDGVIQGYAALHFNGDKRNQSADLGGFRERLANGCFERALAKGSDTKCLFNHDQNQILGRTGNGSLQLSCDNTGLAFRCNLGKQSYAQDLRESIRTGLVNQCSFAFSMDPDDPDAEEWGWDDDGEGRYRVRTINRIGELLDVSAVCSPAYPATSVGARQLWPNGEPEVVLRALRHEGVSDTYLHTLEVAADAGVQLARQRQEEAEANAEANTRRDNRRKTTTQIVGW